MASGLFPHIASGSNYSLEYGLIRQAKRGLQQSVVPYVTWKPLSGTRCGEKLRDEVGTCPM